MTLPLLCKSFYFMAWVLFYWLYYCFTNFHFCCCCSVFICLVTPCIVLNMNWILVLRWCSESSSKKGWKSMWWRTSAGTFPMKVSYILDEWQSCCTTSQNGIKLQRFVPCDPFLIQQGSWSSWLVQLEQV